MIRHDVEQGTPEWQQLRLGIPTASSFDRILTPKTMKLSAQARSYALELVAETLIGRPLDEVNTAWIERGVFLEPEAVKSYEFSTDRQTEKVGFITTDDGLVGASPDRLLVDINGAVEIKCPAPNTHMRYLIDGFGADYVVQVQGQMLVGGFEYVDRYSYHPELPPAIERTYRDEAMIVALKAALDEFNAMKFEILEKARATGFFGSMEQAA